MWTSKNRGRYDRSRLRYPSNLTDEEWALVEPVIPPAKRRALKYDQAVGHRLRIGGPSRGCDGSSVRVKRPPQTAALETEICGQRLWARRAEKGSRKPGLINSWCKSPSYNGIIRARSNSTPARPYMARLRVFSLLICPSVCPLLQGSDIAFCTASRSWRIAFAKRCIA